MVQKALILRKNQPTKYSTVIRWLKKFRSGCKNLNEQERSYSPKIVDSKAVLQAKEVNPAYHRPV